MRKIFLVLAMMAATWIASPAAFAQNGQGEVLVGNTTPPPLCTAALPIYVNLASGISYSCHNGTFVQIGTGSIVGPLNVTGAITATGSISSISNGVDAGQSALVGNTANYPLIANAYNEEGPATATYTAFFDQPGNSTSGGPTTANSVKLYAAASGSPLKSQWVFGAVPVLIPGSTAANTITSPAGVTGLTINGAANTTVPNFQITNQFGNTTWDSGGGETTNGSLYFSYTGNHIGGGGTNNDIDGTIAIASSTTGVFTFAQAYTSVPICTVAPQADPTAVGVYWVTTSVSAVTVHIKLSGTLSFTYHCLGNPN